MVVARPDLTLMRNLLWVDSSAGLVVGVFVLALSPWLGGLYGMSRALILGIGGANVVYGLFALSLARRQLRPRPLIALLAGANAAWAIFCVITVAAVWPSASWIGLAHLGLEALFGFGLAVLEWRHRDLLANRAVSARHAREPRQDTEHARHR